MAVIALARLGLFLLVLVAGGALYVSTDRGSIHCFRPRRGKATGVAE